MARILIIDDDDTLRGIIAKSLTHAGHTVSQANNGRKGVALYRSAPTDLVITDLVMPEQEGMETIKILHQSFPTLPIIAMSGGLDGSPLYLDLSPARRDDHADQAVHAPTAQGGDRRDLREESAPAFRASARCGGRGKAGRRQLRSGRISRRLQFTPFGVWLRAAPTASIRGQPPSDGALAWPPQSHAPHSHRGSSGSPSARWQ